MKEVLIRRKDDEFIFTVGRWYSKIVRMTLRFLGIHSKAGTNRVERRLQWRTSRRIGRVSTGRTTDDAEARADFWSIQGDFIYRHHNEPQVQLCVPKEETFPVPLKYIDVARSTHTDLDVMQEERIDDYWNVESSKHLSNSWIGFTKFTLLKEKPQKRFCGPGGDWQRSKQLPDQIMRCQKFGRKLVKPLRMEKNRNGQKRNRNALRLRGIYFIDPHDRENSEILKNARRILERFMAPLMPWKRHSQASWKRMQSRRLAMKRSLKRCLIVQWNLMNPRDSEQNLCSPETMRITMQVKDLLLWHITIWCTSLFFNATSDENFGCKSCCG